MSEILVSSVTRLQSVILVKFRSAVQTRLFQRNACLCLETASEGRRVLQNVKVAHTLGKEDGEWPRVSHIPAYVYPQFSASNPEEPLAIIYCPYSRVSFFYSGATVST
jgi:hypothetical protein